MYHGYFFQNAEAEAIFSWSGEHVAGNVHVLGESWVLEGCGDQCFLWIKQTNDWLDETSAPDSKIRGGVGWCLVVVWLAMVGHPLV